MDIGRAVRDNNVVKNERTYTILVDHARHLVAIPSTITNTRDLADAFDIPRHWIHATRNHRHVDIPQRDVQRVLSDPRVRVVSSRDIVLAQRARA